jgi:hypothetical protein
MLRLVRVEIWGRLDEGRERPARVEQRLRLIGQQEGAMPTQEVLIKSMPAQTVAPVRNTLAKLSGIGELFL